MSGTTLRAVAGGAAAALAVWALDAATLGQTGFAGAQDEEARRRVVEAAGAAISGLELRLALLHLGIGALAGGLVAAAGPGPLPVALRAALVTLAGWGLALLGTMARYPQLYVDSWWLAGGLRARFQDAVCAAGPRPFDVLLALLAAVLIARGLARATRGQRAVAAAAVGAAALLALGPTRPARAADGRRPNLLVLAIDSLRSDRLTSAEVMPFAASRVARGTLFRHAFTPVARTFPSWVSLLTGREPRDTGVRTMFPDAHARAGSGSTFVDVLRDEGYRTFVVSDFAGDVFPRFHTGFEDVNAPHFTVDSLARASVLAAHGSSLPLLRVALLRRALPEWRNLATLSDPGWLADEAMDHVARDDGRPFAGVVFFSTAHFPYAAPWPYYARGQGDYAGPYRYHAPPARDGEQPGADDVRQVRARYDGALAAVDAALAVIHERLREAGQAERTVVVVTGDHGEELYERAGIAGHGDELTGLAQHVPLLLEGPGVPAGRIDDAQVRLYDLGPTLLSLAGVPGGERFGDGVTLLEQGTSRPICIETGIWFWPGFPAGMRGRRLEYEGISALLEMDPATREMVLRRDRALRVEASKDRGVVLGHRLWHERPTPTGLLAEEVRHQGVPEEGGGHDLRALFEARCVTGDPHLRRHLGVVLPTLSSRGESAARESCETCGLDR